MDIDSFEDFLKSQRQCFAIFLKGCSNLGRDQMRHVLKDHDTQMTLALTTTFPILPRRSVSSPFASPTPIRSAKRTTSSTFKFPAKSFRSQSPPDSNRPFKSPGTIGEVPELSIPRRYRLVNKRNASSTSVTPANTPNSKKSPDPKSASKTSSHTRTPSRGRGGWRGGMTIGGAGRLFKTITPKGKGHATADYSDSSAGSPLSSDPYPKRSTSSKKYKTPTSPFEIAARKAEHKNVSYESESTSDFEIALPKSTVRKVSSAKSQKEKVTAKKDAGDRILAEMDSEYEEDDMWQDREETPSKKQKIGGDGSSGPSTTIEID